MPDTRRVAGSDRVLRPKKDSIEPANAESSAPPRKRQRRETVAGGSASKAKDTPTTSSSRNKRAASSTAAKAKSDNRTKTSNKATDNVSETRVPAEVETPATSTRRSWRLKDVPQDEEEEEVERCISSPLSRETSLQSIYTDLKRKRSLGGDEATTLRTEYKERLNELEGRQVRLDAQKKLLDVLEAQLAEKKTQLDRREEETKSLLVIAQGQRAGELFKELEDTFSCSLCFEVIACPYTLRVSTCGHSFCAICLLKWFFTHLHVDCGQWHERLECPLCRASLPETPAMTPRSLSTCPFAPNRLADEAIGHVLESLASVFRATDDLMNETSTSSPTKSKGKGKAKRRQSRANPLHDAEDEVSGWREGGSQRKEWEKRDRTGREKMNDLIARWRLMQDRDFIAFKQSLRL